jgi:hypothetical protein
MSKLIVKFEKLSKFLSSTAGRDKFYRIIQYVTKLIAYYLGKSNPNNEYVKKLQLLSIAVGQGRKRTQRQLTCLSV